MAQSTHTQLEVIRNDWDNTEGNAVTGEGPDTEEPAADISSAPGSLDNPPSREKRGRRRSRGATKPAASDAAPTRISGAWTAVAIVVLLGVALVDFIVENTRSVQIDFFSASGHIPVAVALLAAALAGAAVVLGVGISRTAQLRLVIRRHRRRGSKETRSPRPPE